MVFQTRKGGQARRNSLLQQRKSISGLVEAKSLEEGLESLGFSLRQAEPEIGKGNV